MPLACDDGDAQKPDDPVVDGGASDGHSDAGADPDDAGHDGGGGDATAPEPSGQLPKPWSEQCVATFTRDFIISSDPFPTSGLMVKQGDQLLLHEYGTAFGGHFSVFQLSEQGASTIDMQLDNQPFPFTSNCAVDAGDDRVGVFVDVVLYEDEAMTTEACRLGEGTLFPFQSWMLEWISNDDADVASYRLEVSALPDECEGATVVYFKTPVGSLPLDTMPVP